MERRPSLYPTQVPENMVAADSASFGTPRARGCMHGWRVEQPTPVYAMPGGRGFDVPVCYYSVTEIIVGASVPVQAAGTVPVCVSVDVSNTAMVSLQ